MKLSKGHRFFVILFFLLVGTGLGWAQPIDRPAAMVKLYESEAVSQSQLKKMVERMEKSLGRVLTADEKRQVLDQMIDSILIMQAASKEKITATETEVSQVSDQQKTLYEQQLGKTMTAEEFRALLEKSGLTWDAFLKEIKQRLIMQKYIKQKKGAQLEAVSPPTDKEITDYYTANQHLFVSPEMVRFKQIFINPNILATQTERDLAKKKAQTILREIRAGGSFDNYWEIYDDAGRIKIGAMSPAILQRGNQKTQETYGLDFCNAVFSLAPGVVSEVITSKAGLHIILVLEKIPFKVLGLDDLIPPQNAMTVRTYLRTLLSQAKGQEALQKALDEIIKDLRRIAEVKIFEENLTW